MNQIELVKLHPGQASVVAGARRFNVLMCGRRFGKTALGKDIAITRALAGRKVGWFAATYKILNPAFDELEAVLRGIPGFKKSETERWLQEHKQQEAMSGSGLNDFYYNE